MDSSWLWSGLRQCVRGRSAPALLTALLVLATPLPGGSRLGQQRGAVFASGALFRAVFLSLVASTTALVRHNLPPCGRGHCRQHWGGADWQIAGPSLVG